MYIERVPNRNSPPAILLRESYREGDKICKRTIANLSQLPDDVIDNLKAALKGGKIIDNIESVLKVKRSLPHGHIAAILGTIKKIGLEPIIESENNKRNAIIKSLITARIIDPKSKLATSRGLRRETANSSLGKILNLEKVTEDDLYEALDWLGDSQEAIEEKLAAKELREGSLVLYDLTSTYLEGEACNLGKYGYSRDKKRGYTQIVFGLICNSQGCPVAVEVFPGNTNDASTVKKQIEKVRDRFRLSSVVWVGDKGMLTNLVIKEELSNSESIDWITTLRKSQIKQLVERQEIQLGLFDERNIVEIESDEYPGERLVVCKNPLLAASNQYKREELIKATAIELDKIVAATQREKRALSGQDKIGLRVGKVINKYKVGKYFELEMTDNSFHYSLKQEIKKADEVMDGLYMIRTSVKAANMSAIETVKAYKKLAKVEQAFRSLKSIDLKVRPIYHYRDHRVKAHIFLCMLSYYVEWYMRQSLTSLLFEEEPEELSLDESRVLKYQASSKTKRKSRTKKNELDEPVHSFRTLLNDLGTICLNTIEVVTIGQSLMFEKITELTDLQQKVIDLLKVTPFCTHVNG
ncbi:MAG: IS1634 family transposase [Gloeocapsa sp. DLM2.Bin57]|nr:MAG: IS1634 family transposase [Gloeocapsa sp. DLM2.Bin57]